MTSKAVREEMCWHEQQDRLSREDNKTDSGIPLHALPSVRTTLAPPPSVDELDRDFFQAMSKEELITVAYELHLDAARLRRELDKATGVIR
jgi:hypothetical protein